jgi:FlaA1/EpsC-like NDP-sugar epimerase
MQSFFKNKKILITGACGTIGRELVRQLLNDFDVSELIGIDNNESELFFLEQTFSKHHQAHFYLADIRDQEKVERATRDMNVVFHTAAFKHVILCERSPFEAVQTNLLGIQNLISAASRNKVDRVIFTSSDKAVNPTNVMGTSKLMGERLITAANSNSRDRGPVFSSTRFGNVLGSRGSVIPIFREQIRKGGPVTLTDPEMTRFIMSIEQAVRLVIDSAFLMKGGEVFITKMPVIRIKDLADVMIETLAPQYGHRPADISIEIIGSKPGEKMYEELMSQEETRRSLELPLYFSVLPAFKGLYRSIHYDYHDVITDQVNNPYHSGNETSLTRVELHDFLVKNHLLHENLDECKHPEERYWP